MRRARVEMIYHPRCGNCASAYRNLGRAVWRQRINGEHARLQFLMDAMVDGPAAISSREDVWDLAVRIDIESHLLAESATAVHHALARVAVLDPVRVPAFLIDDEHLLHGSASPALLREVLQTLAQPQRATARNLWTGLSTWMS